MKSLMVIAALMIFIGCKESYEDVSFTGYKQIEFEPKGYSWDKNPYKFSLQIENEVIGSSNSYSAVWEYSNIGDMENTLKIWDEQAEAKNELSQSQKDSFGLYQDYDAIAYILEKAKDHEVVIINEGHHMPQHRVFTTQLLNGLKKQGFNHLGLETYYSIPKNVSHLRKNGYPTLKSGYYSKEPQFGNLIRVAHNEGYEVFGYESEGHENGREREIKQAENIQKYLEENQGEKVLIHCGFDHAREGELKGDWGKAMAGRLTEFTDIDPMTIDQVKYSERSKREYESPYYQQTDLEVSSIYLNEEGKMFNEYDSISWFDIAVFHPRSKYYNRPKWMIYGDRKEVQFSFDDASINCPCLVFAYKKGEKIGSAIPYDIQETEDKAVTLVLDESDYNIVIWNQEGSALLTQLTNESL